METVTSQDGTTIAFDRLGEGPPVVWCAAGRSTAWPTPRSRGARRRLQGLQLRPSRSRGQRRHLPYAIEREIEDIQAVIGAAGGSAQLWGSSSGAALALIATASGAPVSKLALWEPPFILDETPGRPPTRSSSTRR